jgi:hypothetical protein
MAPFGLRACSALTHGVGDVCRHGHAQNALADEGGECRLSADIVRRDAGQLGEQGVQVRAPSGQRVGVGGDAEAGRDG